MHLKRTRIFMVFLLAALLAFGMLSIPAAAADEISVADLNGLISAFSNASTDPDNPTEIRLDANIVCRDEPVLPVGRYAILDLNGYKLHQFEGYYGEILVYGDLTVKDSAGGGAFVNEGDAFACITVEPGGVLRVEAGSFSSVCNGINAWGTCSISGGDFSGCELSGISMYHDAVLHLSGNPVFPEGEYTCGIYLYDHSRICIDGTLTVDKPIPVYADAGVFTEGFSTYHPDADPTDYFQSYSDEYKVAKTADGEAEMVGVTAHSITIDAGMENGTVSADKSEAGSGEDVILSATPADGYALYQYTVTDADGGDVPVNDGVFDMPDKDVTVSATFKKLYDGEIKLIYDDGTAGANSSEGPNKLVDGDKNTKWCVVDFEGAYNEFHTESDIIPVGYVLTTGNDNKDNTGRNPKNWVLKGKLNEGDEWTTLATVENDTVLQDKDIEDYSFPIENSGKAYRYFRLEISDTKGADVMQLSEFAFSALVNENDLTFAHVSGIEEQYLRNGNPINPVPTVTDAAGNALTKGTHYEVTYNDDGTMGNHSLTLTAVEGSGYYGSKTVEYRIFTYTLSSAIDETIATRYPYTGSVIKPEVVLSRDGLTFTEGVDYTVKYLPSDGDFTSPGTYRIEIKATDTGALTGDDELYYRIVNTVTLDYVDAAGTTHTQDNVCVLTEDELDFGLTDGWFAVTEDLTYDEQSCCFWDDPIEVNLILVDGKTLTIAAEDEPNGLSGYMDLTVYGQTAGTGKLAVSVECPESDYYGVYAIGADSFCLESGTVEATVSTDYRGFALFAEGGDIEIKGGKLTATAKDGYKVYAIYATDGDVIISGGVISATADSGEYEYARCLSAITARNGSVTIEGGEITATAATLSADDAFAIRTETLYDFETGYETPKLKGSSDDYDDYPEEEVRPTDIIIRGGKITADASGVGSSFAAISPTCGSLLIEDGEINVTVDAEESYEAYGLQLLYYFDPYAGGMILSSVKNGQKAEDIDDSFEIAITGGELTVDVTGGYTAVGIGVNVRGGYIVATKDMSDEEDLPTPPVRIEDGTVTITATAEDACGVCAFGDLDILGGVVSVSAASTGTGVYTPPEFPDDPIYTDVRGSDDEELTPAPGVFSTEGDVNILGGQVTIESTVTEERPVFGVLSSEGDVLLGWTDKDDFIQATNYSGDTVSVVDGKHLTDLAILYDGVLSDELIEAAAGQVLVPGYSITVIDDGNGTVTADMEFSYQDAEITLTPAPAPGYTLDTLTVTCGKTTVECTQSGKDYVFTAPAGDVTVKATFRVKNYTLAFNEEDVSFKGATPYVIRDGSAQEPRLIITDEDGVTVPETNYDVLYRENTEAGTAYVTVTLKDGYVGTLNGFFKIYMPPSAKTSVENVEDGILIRWEPVEGATGYVIYRRAWSTTTNGWTTFERWFNTTETEWMDGSDDAHAIYAGTRYQYGVKAYFGPRYDPVAEKNIGGATDNYNLGVVGPLVTTVRITTRKLVSLTPGRNTILVQWEGSVNSTGYQIQCSTDDTFPIGTKNVWIKDPAIYEHTLMQLKSCTAYYVRVRSYVLFEGMTYFGEWSNVLVCDTE